jgi:hypothetical protein
VHTANLMVSLSVSHAAILAISRQATWTAHGEVNFGGTGEIIPMRYAAEQAHLLVQGSYKFGFGGRD